VAIAPDGSWLPSAGNDGSVRIWDAATGAARTTLTGHTAPVNAVAIAPDRSWLASADDDGSVRIWDAAAGHATGMTRIEQHGDACACSPDGRRLVVGGAGGLYSFTVRS
jgi:WD40 repeat protein